MELDGLSFWGSYYGEPKKKSSRRKYAIVGGKAYPIGSMKLKSRRKSKPRTESYGYGSYYPSSKGEHVSATDLYYGGKGAYMVGKKIAKSGPVQSLRRKVSNKLSERRFEKAGFKSEKVGFGPSRVTYKF